MDPISHRIRQLWRLCRDEYVCIRRAEIKLRAKVKLGVVVGGSEDRAAIKVYRTKGQPSVPVLSCGLNYSGN